MVGGKYGGGYKPPPNFRKLHQLPDLLQQHNLQP